MEIVVRMGTYSVSWFPNNAKKMKCAFYACACVGVKDVVDSIWNSGQVQDAVVVSGSVFLSDSPLTI